MLIECRLREALDIKELIFNVFYSFYPYINAEIKMKNCDCDKFDKKQIALAIRNSTLGDELECSLRSEGIIKSCEKCILKSICDGIDKVRDEYIESTSTVVKEFNF